MKLGEILKELGKLKIEMLDVRQIIVRLDDETQTYAQWLEEKGLRDRDIIAVNIWISST